MANDIRKQTGGYIGQSVPRREDRNLLLGKGEFVADIQLPGMVHTAFARSPLPHAEIGAVSLGAARAVEGVRFTASGADVCAELPPISGMQVVTPQGWRDRVDTDILIPDQPLVPEDRVRYVGEAYALVVADTRYIAEDALELIEAEFDPRPTLAHAESALEDSAALVHDQLGRNVAAFLHTKKGDGAAAMDSCPHRLSRRFVHHRYAAMPMETRGVVAEYNRRTDTLTVWSSTQVVHWVRREISTALGMPEDRIRCVAPDVGGGFGGKGHVYPEDILVAWLAKKLDRPVKWVEDRHEHILNSAHSRDNIYDVEIGFDDDGKILAVTSSFLVDSGAYTPVGAGIAGNSIAHMLGPYDIPHYETDCKVVLTNRTPNAPYRGAGRPEVGFAMERAVDLVANHRGLDPAEVRFRNMIPADAMPYEVGLTYRDGVPMVYDSGDYPEALRRALTAVGGLDNVRQRQKEALAEGKYLGLGLGCYVEGTGVGPFEGATVKIESTGKIMVAAGACPQGQGHETVFAQFAADMWQVPIEDVFVTVADTGEVTQGYGTIASRSTVTASGAIKIASDAVQEKAFAIAANMLEAGETDLEIRDAGVGVAGVPEMHVTWRDIARAAKPGWDNQRPDGVEAGLETTSYYEPPTVTWAYAANAALVWIDPDTGQLKIEKYVEVHDAGVLVNPGLADGQVKGGLVQGLGGGLLEELAYDDQGQLLTGSFADYLLPTASDVPPIEVVHMETPSPLNAFGVKGLGEGGAIAPPVVIANAVCDALRPFKAELNSTPVRWEDVAALTEEASPSVT
ncbi:MAG: xanthine dehydrogenase family protein molybdopterin-binding subunit [Pseudomonadota bacterium]|nr:xanthine dehydrogenase family protein molybdopterin-binding subunit [Pseudomonadota bacterium]